MQHFADKHLLPYLIVGHPQVKRTSIIILAAWVLAIIAAAGPFLQSKSQEKKQRHAIDIAIIMDISPSMALDDMAPSRLQRAKWELHDIVSRLSNDRLALIAFSANAYITLPLTNDHATLLHFVDALDVSLAQQKGSNLERGIQLANRVLSNSNPGSKAIFLFSDGETHHPGNITTPRKFEKQNAPLFILGVGTETGAPVRDEQGRFITNNGTPVISKLARSALMELAHASNGLYTDALTDNGDSNAFLTGVSQLAATNPYDLHEKQTIPLFPWLLGASFVLFLIMGLQRKSVLILVVFIALPFSNNEAIASPLKEQQAFSLLQNGDFQKAETIYLTLNSFSGRIGLGVIAYRQQQWDNALDYFTEAEALATTDNERAHAHYNRGNVLARLGRLPAASAAYRRALRWRKNFPRAALNLNLVTEAQHALNDKTTTQKNIANSEKKKSRQGDGGKQDLTGLKNSSQQDPSKTNTNQHVDDKTMQTSSNMNTPLSAAALQLRSLQEDTKTLLRRRFAARDRLDGVSRTEDQPW